MIKLVPSSIPSVILVMGLAVLHMLKVSESIHEWTRGVDSGSLNNLLNLGIKQNMVLLPIGPKSIHE